MVTTVAKRTAVRRRWGGTRAADDAVYLVQPDAVAVLARRFSADLPFGVGRHSESAVRPRARARAVPRVHGPARVRRCAGLRRYRRQRAPSERLRVDAVAEPHRRDA